MHSEAPEHSHQPDYVTDHAREPGAIIAELELIVSCAEQLERDFADQLQLIEPRYADSALNLLHYMALRHFDIRSLQTRLAALGLSSLGRAESHVMASLQIVLRLLRMLANQPPTDRETDGRDLIASQQCHETHVADILGTVPADRTARIMVTLPVDAATDPDLVHGLLASGVNVARINCAHDNQAVWSSMITNVRQATAELGKECRIFMDLAGPRLRSGRLAPGPGVLRLQPRRDALGKVIAPKRLRLTSEALELTDKGTVIPVPDKAIRKAKPGDYLAFVDTRGKKRKLRVTGSDKHGLSVECYKTAYIESGTKLKLNRQSGGKTIGFSVGELPAREQPILLRKGDRLLLQKGSLPGAPALIDPDGTVRAPAHISCTFPEVFRFVRAGAPVFLNDGKIAGVVQSVTPQQLEIRITRAKPSGSKLRSDKSLNFPESDLRIDSLTETDRANLEYVARHADAVALSFVRKPQDILEIHNELAKYPDTDPGIIIKIETQDGFTNLPRLLLAAMRRYPVGVMIARGDLAIECGWERLAEIQEEILWLCEAARVPVIWATQVLESETRKGQPSRAEISDAAMSQRADCVMLNKGPHIIEAIRMLDSILRRMQNHQSKKTATLRKLSIANVFDPQRG